MIKEIVKDPLFLGRKSLPATPEDSHIAADLADTLYANRERCVGMAANMIGVLRRAIVFYENQTTVVMFNPEIIKKEQPYTAEEGCLSLEGTRKTTRYKKIKVQYQNEKFEKRIKTFTGFTAQIILHEIDHCDGILI